MASARSQLGKAPLGFDDIFDIFSLGTVVFSSLNQGPSRFIGENGFMIFAPMRVDSVPASSAEPVAAFRTHLLETARLDERSDFSSVFDQPKGRILDEHGRRFTQNDCGRSQASFLFEREVNFHG